MNETTKVYAIDFDGTIIDEGLFPNFGQPKPNCVNVIKRIIENRDKVIIWTCRGGEKQEKGIVDLLNSHGIYDFVINKHSQIMLDRFSGADSPKVFADIYIDDRNLYSKEINWFEIETILFGVKAV